MNKRQWLIIATAAGLLATTGAAGASGLVNKVSGLLRGDVAVTVNGTDTSIHPVYIDGKAYLPARDMAAALGYGVQWNGQEIALSEQEQQPEVEQYMQGSGVIVDVAKADNGSYRIEFLGHGSNNWVILFADDKTALTDADGKPFAAAELKPGMQIHAQYGPVMTMSFPGQSHAASIQVGEQRLVKEEAILGAEQTDDGWRVRFGESKDGEEVVSLVLNAGKETMLVTPQGYPIEWTQLKPGSKVRAYYGPIMTKSLPPQSPAHILVLLDEQPETLAPAAAAEFRELAWKHVPEEEKEHLLTKKEEALVELVAAEGAAVIATTDGQKKVLAELQAKGGKLVAVTYRTDQDALLGPLTVAIHPETKELLGYFLRM